MSRFTFLSHNLPADGYSIAGVETARALRALGAEMTEKDLLAGFKDAELPREWAWNVYGPAVALCAPVWWRHIHVDGPFIGFTMNESTRLFGDWVRYVNKCADLCLVPCEQNLQAFQDSGVRVPIWIVPLGINPEQWHPLRRERNGGPYRFLWSGTPDKRKGWDVVYRAFRAAFGDRDDVRLMMHFREYPRGLTGCADRNVWTCAEKFHFAELKREIQDADCFVYPSRGEGWGLPPREAAATGLPVIATDWGGMAEDVFHWGLPLRVKGLSTAEYGFFDAGTVGEWAEPDFDHLVELMRWCVEERKSAALIGQRGAEWLAKHGTWQNTALGVMAAVREMTC